ncbi:hypothetical protein D3C85_1128280 [compost metagenome]
MIGVRFTKQIGQAIATDQHNGLAEARRWQREIIEGTVQFPLHRCLTHCPHPRQRDAADNNQDANPARPSAKRDDRQQRQGQCTGPQPEPLFEFERH